MLCYAQSVMSDSVTPWPVACQASLLMGFSRQEYWSRLPFPTPGDLPNPGIEPVFLALVGRFFFFFYFYVFLISVSQIPRIMSGTCCCCLLLRCFIRIRLCAAPQMAAHQAPPSLGFSRQEHWSGLPFPSPVYESEK